MSATEGSEAGRSGAPQVMASVLRVAMSKRYRLAAGLCASALVLALLVRSVDGARFVADIGAFARRGDLLAVIAVVYSAAFWLRAVAWRMLLPRVGVFSLFSILQTALLVNHLLPTKAGELLRPAMASRLGAPAAQAATSTVVARLLDLTSLLLIAAVFLASTTSLQSGLRALAVPALAVALGTALVLWLRSEAPFPKVGPQGRWSADARSAIRSLSASRLALAAMVTLASWALEASVLLGTARLSGVDIAIPAAIGVTAFTVLFQVFHFTPGGLGVYEASMTGALALYGVPLQDALALALLTHGVKFLYSFTFGLLFTLAAARELARGRADRQDGGRVRTASRLEVAAARIWNVLNEGKPFTVVFVLGMVVLLGLLRGPDAGYWARAGVALLVLAPLFAVFYKFAYPLKLRVALWVFLGLYLLVFRSADLLAAGLVVGLYLWFTVFLWGTVYYHLRIGMPWSNFVRFWRLVLENPDSTSGNFLEQVPKLLLLVFLCQSLVEGLSWPTVAAAEAFFLAIAVASVLLHQWLFTWAPAPPLTPTRRRNARGQRWSRRVIAIVIDGCRADKLRAVSTPFIDRLRREGTEFVDVHTVYPARTVTCFSSMLTGAVPRRHGMAGNFILRPGVRCDSIFAALKRHGLKGRLVGIAHFLDAFGEEEVRTVSAVAPNSEVDQRLVDRAQQVLLDEDPDLLVLQLIGVDQTGHARGSYNREYLEMIAATDRLIEQFLGWCAERGFLEDATVLVTADHGQGIGIGGHGHASPSEVHVPCILWGPAIPRGVVRKEPRSILDIAPTASYLLGVAPPQDSVGQVMVSPDVKEGPLRQPLAAIIPARNEALNLRFTLAAIPRRSLPDLTVIVVDDGSTDGTAEVARQYGADLVVRHEQGRGLGAALRTGLEAARSMNARAAVYIDADGEYDPREMPRVLEPVLRGKADYVLGSRFKGRREGQPWTRLLGNLTFTGLLCLAAGRLISDGQTGFRAFSRRALEVAEIVHDYNYAQVLTLDLLKKGMRLTEVPVSYRRRRHGRSFIRGGYLWRVPLAMARQLLRG